jgi:4-amino-4-deoxy-L-arabinose transferase-like glycosyltransferase
MEKYFKRSGSCLIIIFLTALFIRLYPVIVYPNMLKEGFGQFVDTHLYHRIAYNVYKGNGFSGIDDGRAYGLGVKNPHLEYKPAIARGPGYPLFIYSVYKVLGSASDMESPKTLRRNLDKVRIVQCVLDAAVCLLVFCMGRVLYPANFWPALLSACIYCFCYYNIYYSRQLMAECVTAFLLSCSLLFSFMGLQNGKKRWWIAAGTGFGLTVLCRTEYILFIPFLSAYLCYTGRKHFSTAIKRPLILILSATFIILPWTIRNYLVFNELIIVSIPLVGINLYYGTYEHKAWWTYPDNLFADDTVDKGKILKIFKSFSYHFRRGTIDLRKFDNMFLQIALSRIRNNPLQCFKEWIKKLPHLWHQNSKIYGIHSGIEGSGMFFIFYFIFALCAYFLSGVEEKGLMTPVFLLFFYLNIIFFPLVVLPRYGVPLMPGLVSLVGIGIWNLLNIIRNSVLR